jgi:hypothetical protein
VALIVLVLSILSVQYALVMRIATELLISVVQSAGATMIAWHLVQSAVAMRCVTESLREGRALSGSASCVTWSYIPCIAFYWYFAASSVTLTVATTEQCWRLHHLRNTCLSVADTRP